MDIPSIYYITKAMEKLKVVDITIKEVIEKAILIRDIKIK